jgi:DNA polymerase eta
MTTFPTARVVAHVDLDAFYAQVEVLRDPARLANRPVGVVQYNPNGDLRTYTPDDDRIMNDSNGSLIAVGYLSRAAGVKRQHSGPDARKLCPDIQLVQVPTAHGKADLTIYRDAGKQVLDILARCAVCERASIDECYLDLTLEAQVCVERM